MNPLIQQHRVGLDAAKAQDWDIVIIGSGMGGGTAAYALAQKGYRVLIIEKGHADLSDAPAVGVGVETLDPEKRLFQGKWPTQLSVRINGGNARIWAPLGCGLGGSSSLYAAALGRLEPLDFDKQEAPDGKALSWPITYEELEPYYEQAETLYSVCGTEDPLSSQKPWDLKTPPPMAEVDEHFFNTFKASGLNPYRLHVGVKYSDPNCTGCGGHVCNKACKQSSAESCILPALRTGKVALLDDTEVLSIEANRENVESLLVEKEGVKEKIRARRYILAAGGYFSPVILQRSVNDDWPDGLANDHDLVGRNLMFHISEHIALWPKGKFSSDGPRKSIALRDFYRFEGQKYGEFQSTGLSAGFGNVLFFLRTVLDQSWFRYIPLLRHALRIPAYIAAWLFKEATVFACILEDFPYRENRIVADDNTPSGMRIEYTVHDELKSRVRHFRKHLKGTVQALFMFPMSNNLSLNYGHPCGTCSSGDDPESSVVDRNGKVHELGNLYIADASIMPTSGGTNPSLTIAAMALRISDLIDQDLSKKPDS